MSCKYKALGIDVIVPALFKRNSSYTCINLQVVYWLIYFSSSGIGFNVDAKHLLFYSCYLLCRIDLIQS